MISFVSELTACSEQSFQSICLLPQQKKSISVLQNENLCCWQFSELSILLQVEIPYKQCKDGLQDGVGVPIWCACCTKITTKYKLFKGFRKSV